jgi:hypothetical protein
MTKIKKALWSRPATGSDRQLGSLFKALEDLVDGEIITNVLTEDLFDLKDMI